MLREQTVFQVQDIQNSSGANKTPNLDSGEMISRLDFLS